MKRITYVRALEVDQLRRGFFLWWNSKYISSKTSPNPAPTVEKVIDDLTKDRMSYTPAIYEKFKMTGICRVMYTKENKLWKEIKYVDGIMTGYLIYSLPYNGDQKVIARRGKMNDPGKAPETAFPAPADQSNISAPDFCGNPGNSEEAPENSLFSAETEGR